MLYFSKLRICLVFFVALFFVFVSSSNFQYFENNFITKKINLGLDLQGGSYLLLEIDNDPVELQKLQNTTTVIRNFLKSKEVRFNDLKIEDNKIKFIQFWEKVEKYRKEGYESLIKPKKKIERKKQLKS